MAEKMSWTELRKELARRAGVSEKEAGAFLNAFNSQVVAALKQDKQVKINGLGTFKLQTVAPRRSVNVSTGEAFTIEGYNKLTFAPEAGIKELVENGSAKSDAIPSKGKKKSVQAEVELDPLKKLGEQATEIVDILGELGQSPTEKLKKGKKKAATKKPVAIAEPQEPSAPEEPKEPIVPVMVSAPEVAPKEEPQTAEQAEATRVEEKAEEVKEPEKPKKRYHFLRDTLICVVCLLLLLLLGYFFLRSQLSSWIESLVQPNPAQTEIVTDTTTVTAESEETEPIQQAASEEPQTEEPANAEPAKAESTQTETEKWAEGYEILTVEPMHQDSRMTWMAKRYYGDKKFWVYIYDANKDRILNPGKIAVGTPVRVPKLTAAQMDTTRADTRERLERLTLEAEAACWAN